MDLFSNKKRSLFIARPWDTSMKETYGKVMELLSKEWDIQDGSNIIKEDKATAKREMFINRNEQLYDMFVSGIQKSDVFIADVTNVNANVMVELGIAIQLNKNVIIVTGQDKNKLPFDIHGFKADKYDSLDDLMKILKDELSLYLDIRNQNFDHNKYFPENYFRPLNDGQLTFVNNVIPIALPKPIKNLRLRIEYKFINTSDVQDWIGVHLRAYSKSSYPSELVYVRKNNDLEIVTLPTRQTPAPGEIKSNPGYATSDGFSRLELILEENKLLAATSERKLFDELIQLESFGNIYLQATWHSQDQNKVKDFLIKFRNLEIISLDTISPT